jgi:hypothetical protein
VTRNVNDLTLGAAKARRDLACRYTLGFYDRSPGEYRQRALRVGTTRPGLRVVHGSRYSFRSPEERRKSRLTAAWMVPGMFEGDVVRAHVFPLRPATPRTWELELAVEFPVRLVEKAAPSAIYRLGGVVRAGTKVEHRFSREVRFASKTGGPLPDRKFSFLQRLDLAPGAYDLTVLLEDPDQEKIFTTNLRVEVPAIPRGEVILVSPMLARRAGGDLVVRGGVRQESKKSFLDDPEGDQTGTSASFTPILVHEVPATQPIAAWTSACLVTRRDDATAVTIARHLFRDDQSTVGSLEPLALDLRGKEPVRCERLLDILPVQALPEGGYRFEASLDPAPTGMGAEAVVPFSVTAAREPKH